MKKSDLFESLMKQTNLTKVDLEGLKIDPAITEQFLGFISQSKSMSFLNLNHTGISLPPLFAALSESKSQIRKLTISGNKLKKKTNYPANGGLPLSSCAFRGIRYEWN
jgi:hypothetical protein